MLKRLSTVVVVGLATTLLLFIGYHRLVAGDEGFYTLAIRLVAEGDLPYSDFFYPQMPLLPYVYSGIGYFLGSPDWHTLRIIASLCAAVTACTAFCFLLSYTTWLIAACSLVTLLVSPLFFPWVVTIETYSLAAPLLLISVLVTETLRKSMLTRDTTRTDTLLTILVGASLSMATQTRLYSAALLPLLYLYTPRQLKLWFLISFVGCSISAIGMFMLDPYQFWFNNLEYHLSRAHTPPARQIEDKAQMFLILLGFLPSQKFVGPNTAVLFWSGLVGTISCFRTHPVIALASMILTFISFIPSPSYYQYFSLIAPLWAILCGVQLFKIARTQIGTRLHLQILLPPCLLIVGLLGYNRNLEKYLYNGKGVMGIPKGSDPANFTLLATNKVTERINARFGPSDVIFANWNGYLLGALAKPFPGSENIFGIRTAGRFPTISKKLHLSSYEEILTAVEQGKVSGVVMRTQFERTNAKVRQAINRVPCLMVDAVAGARIFDCRKSPVAR
jgi:hypothetical protein